MRGALRGVFPVAGVGPMGWCNQLFGTAELGMETGFCGLGGEGYFSFLVINSETNLCYRVVYQDQTQSNVNICRQFL